MVKISIVTPTFNCVQYIEECIQSIMAQKCIDYEHIIIDGGSTDGTLDILHNYQNRYPMRWVSEPDNGMYDAITKGFKMATGNIYAWINSDDCYFPWTLGIVARAFEKKKIQWLIGIPSNKKKIRWDGNNLFIAQSTTSL